MENREIMWIGLAQVLAVVLGFVLLGIVLKFYGWPEETLFHFYAMPRTLREFGYLLLIVPVAWTFYAMVCIHVEKGLLSGNFASVLGALLATAIFLAFLMAATNPGSRGVLMHVRPS